MTERSTPNKVSTN